MRWVLIHEGPRQSWGMMGGLHVGRKYEPELSCVEMKPVSTKELGMKFANPWETSFWGYAPVSDKHCPVIQNILQHQRPPQKATELT